MQVFKKLETTLSMSYTDHSQSDGQIEQVSQIIEDMLRAYVGAKPTKWERYLQILKIAYNSSKHTSIGYSPFMLTYGFQPRAEIDVNIHHDELRSTQNFLRDMQDMLHIARNNIKTAQDRVFTPIIIGSLVYSALDRRYFYVYLTILRYCLRVSALS